MDDKELYYAIESKRIEDRQKQQSVIAQRPKVANAPVIGNRNASSGLYDVKLPDGTVKTVGKKLFNSDINPAFPVRAIQVGQTIALDAKSVAVNPQIRTASHSQESNPHKAINDQGHCQGYTVGQKFNCKPLVTDPIGNVKVLGYIMTPFNEGANNGKIDFYVFGWRKNYHVKVLTLDGINFENLMPVGRVTDVGLGTYFNNYPFQVINEQIYPLEAGQVKLTSIILDANKGNDFYVTLMYRRGLQHQTSVSPETAYQEITYTTYKNNKIGYQKTDRFHYINNNSSTLLLQNFPVFSIPGFGYWFSKQVSQQDSQNATEVYGYDYFSVHRSEIRPTVNGYTKASKVYAYPTKYLAFPYQLNQPAFDPNDPNGVANGFTWEDVRISKTGDRGIVIKKGVNQTLFFVDKGQHESTLSNINYGRYWFDVFNDSVSSIQHRINTLTNIHEVELQDGTFNDVTDMLTKELMVKLDKRDISLSVTESKPTKIYPLNIKLEEGQVFGVAWMSNSKK